MEPVLADTCEYSPDADYSRRHKQALSRMLYRCLEGSWVEFETNRYHGDVEEEEHDVENEEYAANRI